MSFFQKPAPWGTATEPCTSGRLGAGGALFQPAGDGGCEFRPSCGILNNQNIEQAVLEVNYSFLMNLLSQAGQPVPAG
jgi:hypothetical protein